MVDDAKITRLNRQYFHRHRPTNVISFPMRAKALPGVGPPVLGEVVISAETAQRQARAVGADPEAEIIFLLIHGILHLLGYDHEGPAGERQTMEAKERELLSLLKIGS